MVEVGGLDPTVCAWSPWGIGHAGREARSWMWPPLACQRTRTSKLGAGRSFKSLSATWVGGGGGGGGGERFGSNCVRVVPLGDRPRWLRSTRLDVVALGLPKDKDQQAGGRQVF